MTASAPASAPRSGVIAPYGGSLVDLMVPQEEREAVKATTIKSLECSDRNACDVELLERARQRGILLVPGGVRPSGAASAGRPVSCSGCRS